MFAATAFPFQLIFAWEPPTRSGGIEPFLLIKASWMTLCTPLHSTTLVMTFPETSTLQQKLSIKKRRILKWTKKKSDLFYDHKIEAKLESNYSLCDDVLRLGTWLKNTKQFELLDFFFEIWNFYSNRKILFTHSWNFNVDEFFSK